MRPRLVPRVQQDLALMRAVRRPRRRAAALAALLLTALLAAVGAEPPPQLVLALLRHRDVAAERIRARARPRRRRGPGVRRRRGHPVAHLARGAREVATRAIAAARDAMARAGASRSDGAASRRQSRTSWNFLFIARGARERACRHY
eukprot:29793-Pelagococcus_subviridis.AAC.6